MVVATETGNTLAVPGLVPDRLLADALPQTLEICSIWLILVVMTRKNSPFGQGKPDSWPLQRAKAQFSELVRTARQKGPQHVTVHGREEVVVLAADEYRRLTSEETGAALLDAMQACPHPDVDFDEPGMPMPVSEAPEL